MVNSSELITKEVKTFVIADALRRRDEAEMENLKGTVEFPVFPVRIVRKNWRGEQLFGTWMVRLKVDLNQDENVALHFIHEGPDEDVSASVEFSLTKTKEPLNWHPKDKTFNRDNCSLSHVQAIFGTRLEKALCKSGCLNIKIEISVLNVSDRNIQSSHDIPDSLAKSLGTKAIQGTYLRSPIKTTII